MYGIKDSSEHHEEHGLLVGSCDRDQSARRAIDALRASGDSHSEEPLCPARTTPIPTTSRHAVSASRCTTSATDLTAPANASPMSAARLPPRPGACHGGCTAVGYPATRPGSQQFVDVLVIDGRDRSDADRVVARAVRPDDLVSPASAAARVGVDRRGVKAVSQVVLYVRVSSRRQQREGDLDRQVAALEAAVVDRVVAGVFTDVASGLSDRRGGLRRALDACAEPGVSGLVVTHTERLARFGVGPISQCPTWGAASRSWAETTS